MDKQTIATRRADHAEALDKGLHDAVHQLSAMPEVSKVVLFGSYAAGRQDLLTDLDLIVVMDSQLDFVERNAGLARRLHVGVALDLLAYTPDEMERTRERPFMRRALETGRVLYERQPAG